jgi:hypothetical protein
VIPSHEWFITEGLDEQKVLDDVRQQSMSEPIRVHWHSANDPCFEYRHALYSDGVTVEGETTLWHA